MREEEGEGESVHMHVGRGVRVGGLGRVVFVAAVPERKDEGCTRETRPLLFRCTHSGAQGASRRDSAPHRGAQRCAQSVRGVRCSVGARRAAASTPRSAQSRNSVGDQAKKNNAQAAHPPRFMGARRSCRGARTGAVPVRVRTLTWVWSRSDREVCSSV
jgi:hypothetical protein